MADVSFSSCKAKASYPEASQKLAEYLNRRFNVTPVGCRRADYGKLTADDRAIVVCATCAGIFEESTPVRNIEFVWEIIDQDEDFRFPDYHGRQMTIQDCWVASDKPHVQHTVRSLLHKMNIVSIEQEENFEKTRFCGLNMLKPPSEVLARFAPDRYLRRGAGMFHPMTEAEQLTTLSAHCSTIRTKDVVCYCKFCKDGIDLGGHDGVHLLELLFPASGAGDR